MTGSEPSAPDVSLARAESSTGAVVLERSGGSMILRVTGALDFALAPKLRQLVERAARLGPEALVIDLTEVEFLASAGMSELLRASRQHQDLTRVLVAATGRIVLRPLQLTRLADELKLYPTVVEALAAE